MNTEPFLWSTDSASLEKVIREFRKLQRVAEVQKKVIQDQPPGVAPAPQDVQIDLQQEPVAQTVLPALARKPPAHATTAGARMQLEDTACKILRFLAHSPTRLRQEELRNCEEPPLDRKTVSRHQKTLVDLGLVAYDAKNKQGATILPQGRAYLNPAT